jgi:hypothetical protein
MTWIILKHFKGDAKSIGLKFPQLLRGSSLVSSGGHIPPQKKIPGPKK